MDKMVIVMLKVDQYVFGLFLVKTTLRRSQLFFEDELNCSTMFKAWPSFITSVAKFVKL